MALLSRLLDRTRDANTVAVIVMFASLLVAGTSLRAQTPARAASAPAGKVVVTGVVPDEAMRQAILSKAREVYGDRVVDQLGVGKLVAPPSWSQNVQKLITSDLKRVTRGELKINGNVIELSGNVQNEAQSQQLASQMSANLNPTYTVNNGLRVQVSQQVVLDTALA